MEIIQAELSHVPEIVNLLKQELGDSGVVKSQQYFEWKHFKNPFGKSIILIAIESGEIIGFRSFMRWNFVNGFEILPSLRAVDTATKKQERGKGIFRKLTLAAIDLSIQQNGSIIFNTPNPISMKGYLSMGWMKVGKFPINVRLGSLFPIAFSTFSSEIIKQSYNIKSYINSLPDNWSLPTNNGNWITQVDKIYLNWRYAECPVVNYGAYIVDKKYGLIFRIKKLGPFSELRVCECWIESNAKQDLLSFKKNIKKICSEFKPAIITYANCQKEIKQILNRSIGFLPIGPMVTIHSLALNDYNDFVEFNKWQPSMGTMELF